MTNNSGFLTPGHSKLRGFLSYPGSQKLSRRFVVPTWLAWAPKVTQGFFRDFVMNKSTNKHAMFFFGSGSTFWELGDFLGCVVFLIKKLHASDI